LSSLLVVASPSQETANTILDATERIAAVLEEYKRAKIARSKDVAYPIYTNPSPIPNPSSHSYHAPPPHVLASQPQPVILVNPFATTPFAPQQQQFSNPFLTNGSLPTTMATTTSPAHMPNPFPANPLMQVPSHFASPAPTTQSNNHTAAWASNPFLNPAIVNGVGANSNLLSSPSPSSTHSSSFNPSHGTKDSPPPNPYASPTTSNVSYSLSISPFPNGNPYASPIASPTQPIVNSFSTQY
jgi:hypothetical protein